MSRKSHLKNIARSANAAPSADNEGTKTGKRQQRKQQHNDKAR